MNFSGLSLLFSRTDEETMSRVKAEDDHRAFAQLVERWEQPIRRLCTRMLGDAHRGEDLKQETFTRLYQKRQQYEPTGRFSTYLWRIALNVCHDELRRVNRRKEFFPTTEEEGMEDFAVSEDSPDCAAADADDAEIVRRALVRLPEHYRTVLVLRHYEGLKIGKIAEILQIPLGTVNSRLAEGLARLTRMLEPKLGSTRGSANEPPKPKELLVI
jgi:RNA polymerase sigma-70 factor, ECF subfamily